MSVRRVKEWDRHTFGLEDALDDFVGEFLTGETFHCVESERGYGEVSYGCKVQVVAKLDAGVLTGSSLAGGMSSVEEFWQGRGRNNVGLQAQDLHTRILKSKLHSGVLFPQIWNHIVNFNLDI